MELPPLAQRVAAFAIFIGGCFDLDHFRTEFGQQPPAEGAGDEGAHFDDIEAGERHGCGGHCRWLDVCITLGRL